MMPYLIAARSIDIQKVRQLAEHEWVDAHMVVAILLAVTVGLAGLMMCFWGYRYIAVWFGVFGFLTGGTALGWGLAILQFYVLYLAFFHQVELLWAAFSLGVMTMGVAVPSSPGSVGVFELSLVAALSVFGLDPSISLAAALTAHLSNYVLTGLIGSYALAKDGLTLTGVYKDIQEISPGSA